MIGGGTWADTIAAAAPDAPFHLCHPFETLDGPKAFEAGPMAELRAAFPDLERRETIRIRGVANSGAEWIGVCGFWCGTFAAPFLGIPPTGRMAAMRFHEFFRLEDERVAEFQGVWDLPELMMQAPGPLGSAWPMGPSLGREWHVPAPATQDGLRVEGDGARAAALVNAMLANLGNNAEGEAAMKLDESWHPAMSWYGPSGIGTARGISGFRRHHQIPFLNAMPDRVGDPNGGHLFARGNYVGFTAWPGMDMTLNGDGWLGIGPHSGSGGKRITMRSLDFWRAAEQPDGRYLLEENWVLIDLLHVWHQLGVDVLARMRELTAR